MVDATDRHIAWHLAAHVALCSETALERLAHVLFALAPLIGPKTLDGVELDVTNEELANSTNITLYTASRLISEWQRSGALVNAAAKFLCSLQRDSFIASLDLRQSICAVRRPFCVRL